MARTASGDSRTISTGAGSGPNSDTDSDSEMRGGGNSLSAPLKGMTFPMHRPFNPLDFVPNELVAADLRPKSEL